MNGGEVRKGRKGTLEELEALLGGGFDARLPIEIEGKSIEGDRHLEK